MKHLCIVLLPVVLIALCAPAEVFPSIRESVLADLSPSPDGYKIPHEVVVFDLWECFEKSGFTETSERADVTYFVTALQGIVNRDKPRLFLLASLALFDVEIRFSFDPEYRQTPVPELDRIWLDELEHKGYLPSVRHTSLLDDLVQTYRTEISGLVLWDMETPASGNIALMAAGCENLLPVSRDLGGGRLRQWLTDRFPELAVTLDLTGRFDGVKPVALEDGRSFPTTGSAKNDAYRYALEKYLKPGHSDPHYMWYNCDPLMWGALRNFYSKNTYGYLGDRNELQQNGMFNADYWIARRAFILDVSPWGDTTPKDEPDQPLGADLATWNDVLHASYLLRNGEFGVVGGFPPWWIKYTDVVGEKHEAVPTEWEFIGLISSYNMVNEGDAAFGISNASFYMHLPWLTPEEVQNPTPPEVPYRKGTTYIAFCMLDYDGSAWTNQMAATIYRDPNRGKLPLNWCINPVIYPRIPHAMRYLYENRTPQDFFGFSDDGAGYVDPLALTVRKGRITESGLDNYERFAGALHQRFAVDHTAFYISPRFVSPWIDMAARLDKGFGYGFPMPQRLVNGVPASYVQSHHIHQYAAFCDELDRVYRASIGRDAYSPVFKAYRCILFTPGMLVQAVEQMRIKYPDAPVEIVDLRTFYRLLAKKLGEPLESPYRDQPPVRSTTDASEGIVATPSAGGHFEIKDVRGSRAWTVNSQQNGLYLCFDVDDAYAQRSGGQPLEVEITYLDTGSGALELQYDSTDPTAPLEGAFKNARPLADLTGSDQWRSVRVQLPDPRLEGRQNDGTDLRICKKENDYFAIREITIRPAE